MRVYQKRTHPLLTLLRSLRCFHCSVPGFKLHTHTHVTTKAMYSVLVYEAVFQCVLQGRADAVAYLLRSGSGVDVFVLGHAGRLLRPTHLPPSRHEGGREGVAFVVRGVSGASEAGAQPCIPGLVHTEQQRNASAFSRVHVEQVLYGGGEGGGLRCEWAQRRVKALHKSASAAEGS
jgi:hypothetical protein